MDTNTSVKLPRKRYPFEDYQRDEIKTTLVALSSAKDALRTLLSVLPSNPVLDVVFAIESGEKHLRSRLRSDDKLRQLLATQDKREVVELEKLVAL